MELLIRKSTQTSQVAAILEKRIVSGKIAPEAKLKSTRDLADSFSVSRQVIKSALNVLEEKKLITRKPRKGIYVDSKIFSPHKKEIVCLTIETPSFMTTYAEHFFVQHDYLKRQNINLTSKSIARENFNTLSFTYELKKLAESHLDCLVVQIPELTRSQMKECLQLPFPVVFIGDFFCGSFPDLEYNQIMEDTAERVEMAMTIAIKRGKKRIAIIGADLKAYYGKVYYEKAQRIVKQNACEMYYAQYSDLNHMDNMASSQQNCVEKIIENFGKPDALILDGYAKIAPFIEAFKIHNVNFPKDLMVITDGKIYPGVIFISTDYAEFSQVAEKRIKEIMVNPSDCQKIILSNLIERTALKISNL